MRIKIYIKVAKDGYKNKVSGSTKSSDEPLSKAGKYGQGKTFLPTVGFAVDFDIPEELFSRAQTTIASINVGTKEAKILSELPKVKKI